MVSQAEYERLRDQVERAISTALQGVEQSILTKFVVIAETVDGDGQRGLWSMAGGDAMSWDTKGMLSEALDRERAATFAALLRDDD